MAITALLPDAIFLQVFNTVCVYDILIVLCENYEADNQAIANVLKAHFGWVMCCNAQEFNKILNDLAHLCERLSMLGRMIDNQAMVVVLTQVAPKVFQSTIENSLVATRQYN